MSQEQQAFEKLAKYALLEPTPEPKYPLWMQVRCHCSEVRDGKFIEEVKEGKIVGMHWKSLYHIFQEDSDAEPGWTYTVEVDGCHRWFTESVLDESKATAESDRLVLPAL